MDTDDIAFFRIKQIVGDLKADPPIDPLLPIGRSSWWAGVKAGRFPQPVKLGPRTTVWRRRDIIRLIERLEEEKASTNE